LQQALPLFRQVGNKSGEANTLTNFGAVYDDTGQPQRALEFYEQALALFRQVGNKSGEAKTLSNLGAVYRSTDQPQKALEFYEQALALYRQVGNKSGEAYTLNGLGAVYAVTGQPQKALDYFQQALPIILAVKDKRIEAYVLANTAQVRQRQGRLTDAKQLFQQAIALLENLRANLGGLSEAKSAFLASNLDTYHRCLNLLLRMGRTSDAFALAQKTKARALLDLLASGKVELTGALSPEENRKEQQLRQNADQLNAALLHEQVQNRPATSPRLASLQQELAQAENALQTYQDSLYARHPDLARKRAARTLTLAEVPAFLPADTALLEYLVLQADKGKKDALDETVLLVVTLEHGKPRLKVYSHSLPAARLTALADAFRRACATKDAAFKAPARLLYTRLLAPAARQLSGKKRLVICPDGPLWGLPFQALLIPSLP
jgi:tetratricopeptide (TPR) repeat protein